MRKALKTFLSWLDSRFPEKVVVTERDYQSLKIGLADIQAKIEAIALIWSTATKDVDLLKEKTRKIEADFTAVKVAAGFGPLRASALQR